MKINRAETHKINATINFHAERLNYTNDEEKREYAAKLAQRIKNHIEFDLLMDVFEKMEIFNMEKTFVPETLSWCRKHYVPKVEKHITCKEFGHSDGMDGACWWCMEMTPYQWHMCCDETWVKSLMRSFGNTQGMERDEAEEFIEGYKQEHPMDNERKVILSDKEK